MYMYNTYLHKQRPLEGMEPWNFLMSDPNEWGSARVAEALIGPSYRNLSLAILSSPRPQKSTSCSETSLALNVRLVLMPSQYDESPKSFLTHLPTRHIHSLLRYVGVSPFAPVPLNLGSAVMMTIFQLLSREEPRLLLETNIESWGSRCLASPPKRGPGSRLSRYVHMRPKTGHRLPTLEIPSHHRGN